MADSSSDPARAARGRQDGHADGDGDVAGDAGVLTVGESARRIGCYVWIESRLFEVLGAWVPTVPELDAKVAMATHARRHAWHAELLRRRLPERRGDDPDALGASRRGSLARFVDALAEPSSPAQTVERLVGVYRVALPHLATAYRAHLARIDAVSDGPSGRVLELALGDIVEQGREGEALARSVLATPADEERAAEHEARLETLLVEAGGITGEGTGEAAEGSRDRGRHLPVTGAGPGLGGAGVTPRQRTGPPPGPRSRP